jgi:hypothetical protein
MLVPADALPVSLYTTNDVSRLVRSDCYMIPSRRITQRCLYTRNFRGGSIHARRRAKRRCVPTGAPRHRTRPGQPGNRTVARHSRPLCFEPECGPCSASHFGSAQSAWARWVFTVTWRDRSRTTSTRQKGHNCLAESDWACTGGVLQSAHRGTTGVPCGRRIGAGGGSLKASPLRNQRCQFTVARQGSRL